MGALDSYLSAPIYLFFGTSTLTNNFLPTLLSLVTLWITYQTLKQFLGRAESLLGLFYLAIPTAISLYCLTEGKTVYLLPIFFGAILMWITLKLGKGTDSRAVGLCWAWGLVAGRYTLLKLLGRKKGPVLIPEQLTPEGNPQEARLNDIV